MRMTKVALMTLAALGAATVLAAQDPTPGLQDLVGARGSSGESELMDRGYSHVRTEKSDTDAYSYWRRNGQCISVRTSEGRYASIVNTPSADCHGGGGEAVEHDEAVGIDDEFHTVCGVMQGNRPISNKCKAVDHTVNGKKIKTVLFFSDMNMVLRWKGGNQVLVRIKGLEDQQTSFATSEGETNFTVHGQTYFYISDKGMARMEVKDL